MDLVPERLAPEFLGPAIGNCQHHHIERQQGRRTCRFSRDTQPRTMVGDDHYARPGTAPRPRSRLHQAVGSRFPSPACLLDRAGAGRPQRPWHRHRARHLQAGSRKPVGTSAWRPDAARSDAPGLSRMEGPHRGSKAPSRSACGMCSPSGRRSARFSSECTLSQVRGIPDSCLSVIQRRATYPVMVPKSNRDTYVIVCER